MWEELSEIGRILKRESAKSIVGAVGVIALSFLLYQVSTDDDDQEIVVETPDFQRDAPKFDKNNLEKLVINDLAKDLNIKVTNEEQETEDEDGDGDNSITLADQIEAAPGARAPASSNAPSNSSSNSDSSSSSESVPDQAESSPEPESDPNNNPEDPNDPECIGDECNDPPQECIGADCPPPPPPPPPPPFCDPRVQECTCEQLGNCPPPPPPPPPCEETGDCPKELTCEELGTCPEPPGGGGACVPEKLIFPNKGPGTYSSNPTVNLFSPDSSDIQYCLTKLPGTCDPNPNLNGVAYPSSGIDVGTALDEGVFIVSFMASDDSCPNKYQYSYVVDSSLPDLDITIGAQYLQTTERVDYNMNSAHSGNSNFFFNFSKVDGDTEFSSCSQLATDFDPTNFGMSFLGDTNPKDLNSITVPLQLEYYAGKSLEYGRTGNQLVSFISDQSSSTTTYGCQMNQVFVYDFAHFEFKTNADATINVNGEMEFSGGFQAYGPGRFPAGASEPVLESGIDNIIN